MLVRWDRLSWRIAIRLIEGKAYCGSPMEHARWTKLIWTQGVISLVDIVGQRKCVWAFQSMPWASPLLVPVDPSISSPGLSTIAEDFELGSLGVRGGCTNCFQTLHGVPIDINQGDSCCFPWLRQLLCLALSDVGKFEHFAASDLEGNTFYGFVLREMSLPVILGWLMAPPLRQMISDSLSWATGCHSQFMMGGRLTSRITYLPVSQQQILGHVLAGFQLSHTRLVGCLPATSVTQSHKTVNVSISCDDLWLHLKKRILHLSIFEVLLVKVSPVWDYFGVLLCCMNGQAF